MSLREKLHLPSAEGRGRFAVTAAGAAIIFGTIFIMAGNSAEKKAKESVEAPADFLRAGFTPQLTEELARALLQLKMELYREDVKNYTFQIKRDGEKIVLIPKYKK